MMNTWRKLSASRPRKKVSKNFVAANNGMREVCTISRAAEGDGRLAGAFASEERLLFRKAGSACLVRL
ncbi:MAG: hypothetical protein Q4F72_07785 [Desulfovibrionaceae bacterium]|nr:hypothetical protein [Desulfovibrionaceae bacterium]